MDEILVFDLRVQKRYFSQVRLELYKEIAYLSRIRKLFHYNLFKKIIKKCLTFYLNTYIIIKQFETGH